MMRDFDRDFLLRLARSVAAGRSPAEAAELDGRLADPAASSNRPARAAMDRDPAVAVSTPEALDAYVDIAHWLDKRLAR